MDWTAIWTFLTSRWFSVAAVGGFAVLAILYGAAYVRALRPQAGTLEWIQLHDRTSHTLAGRWQPPGLRDVAPMAVVAVTAVLAWGYAALYSLRQSFPEAAAPMETVAAVGVRYLAAPALAGLAVYLLVRGLYGSPMAALFSGLVPALDLTVEPLALLTVAVQALLLTRYLTAPAEARFAPGCLWLILSAAVGGAAASLAPSLVLVSAAALVLLVAGSAARFVELGRGWLVPALGVALAAFLVAALAAQTPAAVAAGMDFPELYLRGDFYRFAALNFWLGLSTAFGGPIAAVGSDWPVLLCGLLACVAAVVAVLRRREDLRGLSAAVWFAALAALWALGGVYVAPFGCAVCLGAVWGGLCSRNRRLLAGWGGGCLLALQVAGYVGTWIL